MGGLCYPQAQAPSSPLLQLTPTTHAPGDQTDMLPASLLLALGPGCVLSAFTQLPVSLPRPQRCVAGGSGPTLQTRKQAVFPSCLNGSLNNNGASLPEQVVGGVLVRTWLWAELLRLPIPTRLLLSGGTSHCSVLQVPGGGPLTRACYGRGVARWAHRSEMCSGLLQCSLIFSVVNRKPILA